MHKYSEYSIFTYMPKVLKFAEVYRENLLSYFQIMSSMIMMSRCQQIQMV